MKNQADVLREIADFLGGVAINRADTKDREIALALEQDARALAQDVWQAAQAQQPQQGAVVEAARECYRVAGSCGGDKDLQIRVYAEAIRQALTPAAPAPAQDAAHRIQPIPQAVASEEACELKTNPCANCGTTMSLRCPGCHPAAWPTPAAPAPSEPTDTERMDWLEQMQADVDIDGCGNFALTWQPVGQTYLETAEGSTFRAAVDAAMKQQGGGA